MCVSVCVYVWVKGIHICSCFYTHMVDRKRREREKKERDMKRCMRENWAEIERLVTFRLNKSLLDKDMCVCFAPPPPPPPTQPTFIITPRGKKKG